MKKLLALIGICVSLATNAYGQTVFPIGPNVPASLVGITGTSGTGTVLCLQTSCAMVTPAIGVATGTSLALGGAAIGTDVIAGTGTGTLSGAWTAGAFNVTGSTIPANGIYLSSANQVSFSANSLERIILNSSGLASHNSSGFLLPGNVTASATAPTLIPNSSSSTTGIGAQASGNMSMIVGGAEIGRWVSTGLNIITTTDASASSGSGALQVPGGASIAKRFWLPAVTASSGLQTAVFCQASTGEVIADSVACLASSRRFKERIVGFKPAKPFKTCIAEEAALQPVSFFYKVSFNGKQQTNPNYNGEWAGLIAEDVAKVDTRFVIWEETKGIGRTPHSVKYEYLNVLTICAAKERDAVNDNLSRRLAALEHRRK